MENLTCPPHRTPNALRASRTSTALRAKGMPWTATFAVLLALAWATPSQALAQREDSQSRSERRAMKRLAKETQKQAEAAYKEWEENYIKLQEEHYDRQQSHVKKKMRRGQQKARRHADGRTVPWWRRIWLRRKWKKAT